MGHHNPLPLTGALTPRELEVLALVAAGEPTTAIGERLGIAQNTVKAHLTSIYRKTGARNRVQAVRYYLDRHEPAPARPSAAEEPALVRRQIEELEARLEQLAPAAAEAERLRHALSVLRAGRS